MPRKAPTPSVWKANGHPVKCPTCGCSQLVESKAQLNTAALSFLDLDFLNKTATLLICTDCSHIQWFGDKTKLRAT